MNPIPLASALPRPLPSPRPAASPRRPALPNDPGLARLLAAPQLSSSAKAVAVALVCHWAWTKEYCWPGDKTIAQTVGRSIGQVQRCLLELELAGWIVRERTAAVPNGRRIWLLWRRPAAEGAADPAAEGAADPAAEGAADPAAAAADPAPPRSAPRAGAQSSPAPARSAPRAGAQSPCAPARSEHKEGNSEKEQRNVTVFSLDPDAGPPGPPASPLAVLPAILPAVLPAILPAVLPAILPAVLPAIPPAVLPASPPAVLPASPPEPGPPAAVGTAPAPAASPDPLAPAAPGERPQTALADPLVPPAAAGPVLPVRPRAGGPPALPGTDPTRAGAVLAAPAAAPATPVVAPAIPARPAPPVRPLADELKALPGADPARVRAVAWRLAHFLGDVGSIGFFIFVLAQVAAGTAAGERLLAAFRAGEKAKGHAKKPGAIFTTVWQTWTPPPKPSEINRPQYYQAAVPAVRAAPPGDSPPPLAPSREEEIADLKEWLRRPRHPLADYARRRLAALGVAT